MKTLILKPGALGDTLMMAPSLNALKGRAFITFVGRRPGIEFLRSAGFACADFEGRGWHHLFTEGPARMEGALFHGTELVVGFFGKRGDTVRGNLRALFPDARVRVYDSLPPEDEKIHAARHLAECLRRSGLPLDPERSMTRAREKGLLQNQCVRPARDCLVLHPGSGDPAKNYPPNVWTAIIQRVTRLPRAAGLRPVVLLGPAEAALSGSFPDHSDLGVIETVSCPAAVALTDLLCRSALYIGHDSGVSHLAAMLGAPTIALFKSSDPHRWSPLGPRVRILQEAEEFESLIEKMTEAADILRLSGPARDML